MRAGGGNKVVDDRSPDDPLIDLLVVRAVEAMQAIIASDVQSPTPWPPTIDAAAITDFEGLYRWLGDVLGTAIVAIDGSKPRLGTRQLATVKAAVASLVASWEFAGNLPHLGSKITPDDLFFVAVLAGQLAAEGKLHNDAISPKPARGRSKGSVQYDDTAFVAEAKARIAAGGRLTEVLVGMAQRMPGASLEAAIQRLRRGLSG